MAAIKQVDLAGSSIIASRLLESGRQTVQSRLPALLTVVKEINEPRFPSFIGLRKAKKVDIPVWSSSDLGFRAAQVGPTGSQVTWQISTPPAQKTRLEMLDGPPAQTARQLVERLAEQQLIQEPQ